MDTTISPISWRTVDTVPSLPRGEIHLWWQDLGSGCLDFESLHGLLNERENRRVDRFKVDRVKREFTAARGILKLLLSAYLDRAPGELEFRFGSLGKPSLPAVDSGDELRFNYTDSDGFALYAFAWNRDLGVDLETLLRRVRCRRIIERRFAPEESEALLAMPDREQRRSFLACWTRKEGYGKALGLGIHFPFDCREMCVDCGSSPLSLEDHLNGDAWDIHQLYPTNDFVAALVHPSSELPRRYWRLSESTQRLF